MTILSGIRWNEIQSRIVAETKNREVHQPLVSLYRWWARRPHTLIGAILDSAAATLPADALILDPFSGGGTVAIEASRRGHRVYSQDVNPWAAWGLHVSLSPVDADELARAGDLLLRTLRNEHGHRYDAAQDSTVIHTFRVRRVCCPACSERTWLYPYPMITRASRAVDELQGYFGCRACGSVSSRRLERKREPRCPCGRGLIRALEPSCAHCDRRLSASTLRKAPWIPVLEQRHNAVPDGAVLTFHALDPNARRVNDLRNPPAALAAPIPRGHETSKLLAAGFSTWDSLYPTRQMEVLLAAAAALDRLTASPAVIERLRLALAGAVEMPGHLCRWDRHHPKVFEALSNHRYSFDGLAVEPNPLGPVGRGSIARRIRASVHAAKMFAPHTQSRSTAYLRTDRQPRVQPSAHSTIVQGSSETLLLGDGVASLVLTDPPYFDSVQYGELASLLLAWTVPFGIASTSGTFRRRDEAVPNRARRTGLSAYQQRLRRIFSECERALAPDGRLVLTYHSTNLRAWWALATALRTAGFYINGLAVARTENASDHAKRGKSSFVHDLLIECTRTPSGPVVHTTPRSPAERELLRVGQAMAGMPSLDYAEFRESFGRRVARLRVRRIQAADVTIKLAPRGSHDRRTQEPGSAPSRTRRRGGQVADKGDA
ncbi:MAG: hypothetical protein JNM07_05065 [Phycisphaerae bacterium]|nr:hypothetical protein [Phycisphaerae bacterium]